MKKIALVWGGTGGHVIPLLSIYNYAQKRQTEKKKREGLSFIWIGESDSLEQKIALENHIEFHCVQAGKLRRYFSLKTLIEPVRICIGFFQAFHILRTCKVEGVFSKGWYVSLPVAIAAWILRIPVYLHESDSIPGLANRLVARFAKTVFLTFEQAGKYFPKRETRVIGQILNPALFDWDKSEKGQWKQSRPTHILVIGGSQGSTRILEFILEHIDTFSHCRVSVVLGTLNRHFQKFFAPYEFVTTYTFLSQSELSALYPTVDIAITRAGATVLFELMAFHVRMIMIPLPESANNHQHENAKILEWGEHVLIEERDFSAGAMGRILPCLTYKKKDCTIDTDISEKPLRNIFEVLTSGSRLTEE